MRCRWPVPGIPPSCREPTKTLPFHAGTGRRVDGQAGGGDGGQPHHDRRLVSVARRVRGDPLAGIKAPEAHQRPAVVAPRQQHVELVAAVGTVLVLPDVPGLGVQHEAEGVAVSDRVDLRPMARFVHEGVVGGHRAVVVEAQDLAPQAPGILRGVEEFSVQRPDPPAGGHVDLAVAAEGDPSVEPRVGVEGLGDHQVLHVVERASSSRPRARAGEAAAVVVPLGVGEIDEAVVREVGMHGHVHQPAVAVGPHLRHAGDRVRVERAVAHDAKAAVALGDEHPAAGQERDGPGMRQSSDDRGDVDRVLFGGVDDPGPSPSGGTGTPIGSSSCA